MNIAGRVASPDLVGSASSRYPLPRHLHQFCLPAVLNLEVQ